MKKKRILLFVIDMLAGHWAEGVKVQSTGYAPPNIKDYHELGLIPNFSYLIKHGFWVKRPFNNGRCGTEYGMHYLATGIYEEKQIKSIGDGCVCSSKAKTILDSFNEHHNGKTRMASFATTHWVRKGWWHCAGNNEGLAPAYPDESTICDYAFPWMEQNPDWDFVMIYQPEHDLIGTDLGTPVYLEKPEHYLADKHHHLIDKVDKHLGMVMAFLKDKGWWEETYMHVFSDHAYHLGCDCVSDFVPCVGPRISTNLCWNHRAPYDCLVWDFDKNKPTGELSQCCRRTAFIAGGGALDKKYRGKTRDTAEIIDVPATIADLGGFPFYGNGKSLL